MNCKLLLTGEFNRTKINQTSKYSRVYYFRDEFWVCKDFPMSCQHQFNFSFCFVIHSSDSERIVVIPYYVFNVGICSEITILLGQYSRKKHTNCKARRFELCSLLSDNCLRKFWVSEDPHLWENPRTNRSWPIRRIVVLLYYSFLLNV